MRVSFIGLGIMGLPMAKNLHKARKLNKVFNRTKSRASFFVDTDVEIANSPAEAAKDADLIFVMVSDSKDVEEVILGEDGVIREVKEKAIVVDLSSINPEVTRKIGEELDRKMVTMVDAPVSGGEKGAIEGKLAIMVGGEQQTISTIHPYLQVMGKTITHLGPLGSGGYAKLANQIIVAIGLQSISEAFYLAKKKDIHLPTLYEAIRTGLAGSNVLDQKINNLHEEQYDPGFKVQLHLKDLNNVVEAAQEMGIVLPFTEQVRTTMEKMVDLGLGELDHSSLFDYLINHASKNSNEHERKSSKF